MVSYFYTYKATANNYFHGWCLSCLSPWNSGISISSSSLATTNLHHCKLSQANSKLFEARPTFGQFLVTVPMSFPVSHAYFSWQLSNMSTSVLGGPRRLRSHGNCSHVCQVVAAAVSRATSIGGLSCHWPADAKGMPQSLTLFLASACDMRKFFWVFPVINFVWDSLEVP